MPALRQNLDCGYQDNAQDEEGLMRRQFADSQKNKFVSISVAICGWLSDNKANPSNLF